MTEFLVGTLLIGIQFDFFLFLLSVEDNFFQIKDEGD